MKVLVIEDGFEYSELLERFLGHQFTFERAGDGHVALKRVSEESWDVLLLDMCFDRIPYDRLFGDKDALTDRFNGRVEQCREHLEKNQGIYILAAIRDLGVKTGVLISHDFSRDRNRWSRLEKRYGSVAYVSDNAGPEEMARTLLQLGERC